MTEVVQDVVGQLMHRACVDDSEALNMKEFTDDPDEEVCVRCGAPLNDEP